MNIAIDGNEANLKNRVGINAYAWQILWGLYKLQDNNNSKYKYTIFLNKKPLLDLPKENSNWKYQVIKGENLWVITKLMPALYFSKKKYDLLFSPSHYTVPFSLIPRIVSIMDLGYLDFSGQFKKITFWQLKYWTAISIYVSKRIIAISNATKQDIVRHYPYASKKICVTYLGYDKDKYNTNISENDVRHILKKYSIVDDYILFLGTLKPSKNLEGTIEAFAGLKSQFSNLKLVVAGKKGWLYQQIFEKVKKLNIEERVLFTGFVDEDDKACLYKCAKVLISPSFTEGFGLHVLESMACGTPVVVSDAGSLPEIAGEAGVYVDPKNTKSIVGGLEKILKMPEKGYNQLSQKCIEQARNFSWEKTAKQTINIFERIKENV